MVHLQRTYDVGDFSLHDLTTVVKRSWVLDLCRAITRRGLRVTWQLHSGTRLEEVDGELLDAMGEAGLAYLVLAPESGSEETRRRVKKRMRTDHIRRAIDAAVDSGIPVKVQVMSGLPGDGHEDAWQNVRFAAWLGRRGVDAVGTAIFAPYPGTELFDELLARGDIEMGDDLVFFPVANNDFARPIIRSQRLSPGAVKGYQLATLGAFMGAKALFHPGRVLRSAVNAITSDREAYFFEKLLKAMFTAIARLAVDPCNGAPITWRPIDYRRFSVADLTRKRRMSVPSPAAQDRLVTLGRPAAASERYSPARWNPLGETSNQASGAALTEDISCSKGGV